MIVEEGKRYVRRDGSVSGPISEHSLKIYCWTDGKYTYTHSGRWSTENYETSLDLIEEYKEPEMKEIDFTKPLQFTTPDKAPVHYIGLDKDGKHVCQKTSGMEAIFTVDQWGNSAKFVRIENIPEKLVTWVNFYEDVAYRYPTKEEADRAAGSDRQACVRVEYDEGEGL